MIAAGDRVAVDRIPGVHTVLAVADVLSPAVPAVQVRLAPGTTYGRWRGGDTLAVPAARCTRVPDARESPPIDPPGIDAD